ncbi:MAG: aminotransferase class III-fold pyridoxal phosphate-dependent enzyme [Rhizobiales bacterium]|nr:aminotransferase class III-fold pyridoxal phosphate-dependent enzyme [Hyphomicrobiales bacterium]
MPFTPNRRFKNNPRLYTGASGMYYKTSDGKNILDGMAGLWCVNAGHGQPEITQAIQKQAAELDFVSSFQMGHPAAFELADRLTELAPDGIDHVFFSNSGSEAVDTALKIARAYHRARGEGERTRFISRERAYHGMGWGGLSVSGIGRHRRDFGPFLPGVDHLPLGYDRAISGFSRGQPKQGAESADALLSLIQLHDASTIAAVIVEPVTGSGGVHPAPVGYLNRLREICDQHGILLIFDEVITGFGRIGAAFGAERFGVTPDIMTCAKGMTNGAVPMGATFVSADVYEAFQKGPEEQIDIFHGYTYSAHPLACAAGLATLNVYRDQNIFARAAQSEALWEEQAHSLRASDAVIDIRNIGLLAAVDLMPHADKPGARAAECVDYCYSKGLLVRLSGDSIVLSPPLIISSDEINFVFDTLRQSLALTA